MKQVFGGLALGTLLVFTGIAAAQHKHPHGSPPSHAQPYAGQQNRASTGFSDQEIRDFREGRGMGLARPAELNGYPGPLHVLELADDLDLTPEQRSAVEAIFQRMKDAARSAGARYLEAESAVDAAFRSGGATAEQIEALVRQADETRADVRLSHLAAHLETAPVLNDEQRQRYAVLRGYADPAGGRHHHHHRN